MLRKLAIKIGLGKLLEYIRDAHEGKHGPEAKRVVDLLMANASTIGLVFGSAVLALTIFYGADSNAVLILGGLATSVLLPAGLMPAAWRTAPETLKALWWHQAASKYGDLIAAGIASGWAWSTGDGCATAGGWFVFGFAVPCGASTWALALLAGAVLQFGIVSDLKLAPPPRKPLPAKATLRG